MVHKIQDFGALFLRTELLEKPGSFGLAGKMGLDGIDCSERSNNLTLDAPPRGILLYQAYV